MKKPILRFKNFSLIFMFFTFFISTNSYSQITIPTPESHFGFTPGSDRMLFNYEELISYLEKLDEVSSKIKMENIGVSPMGKPMYAVFISSKENIQNLEKLKKINKELALNFQLSEEERSTYIKDGKAFFLFTLSMHSNEVGPAQALPLIAYELLTTSDEKTISWVNLISEPISFICSSSRNLT